MATLLFRFDMQSFVLFLALGVFSIASGQIIGPCLQGVPVADECPPGYGCYNAQCYVSTGPCVVGTCPNNGVCVNNQLCIDPSYGSTAGSTSASGSSDSSSAATTASTCVDLAAPGKPSDCPANANLCNDPTYRDLMTQQCPKTCNRCPGTGTGTGSSSSTCVDLVGPNGISDCPARAYLCNDPVYYQLMTQQCPKTCGRCT